MKGTSKKISPGNSSKNELKHAANKPGGTGYGGGTSNAGGKTKNELKHASNKPGGLGYGKS